MLIIFRIFIVKVKLLQKKLSSCTTLCKDTKVERNDNFFFGITETKYLHERSE